MHAIVLMPHCRNKVVTELRNTLVWLAQPENTVGFLTGMSADVIDVM